MNSFARAATIRGTMRGTIMTIVATAALVTVVAAVLLLSQGGPDAASARSEDSGAAGARLNPAYQHVVHQGRDLVRSGLLACLGDRAASRATAAMNASMRQAGTQALAEHVDVREAAHAAARSSLVLVADQAQNRACRDRIERVLESVYTDVMSRLGESTSVWRGAVLGDLVPERRFGASPATLPAPPWIGSDTEGHLSGAASAARVGRPVGPRQGTVCLVIVVPHDPAPRIHDRFCLCRCTPPGGPSRTPMLAVASAAEPRTSRHAVTAATSRQRPSRH